MTHPPADLMQGIHACRREFQRLVEPCRPDLHRHCRWLTGDPWDAEDLVQDTLLRAFASLSRRYHAVPAPRAWMLRVATNRWIDLRRARREASSPAPLSEAEAVPQAADPVAFGEAAAILLGLPPRERAAVALIDGQGLSAAEAAACLSCGEGAVRAALHRGRSRLREPLPTIPKPAREPVDQAGVEAFCRAFSQGDLAALRGQLLPQARAEVVGLVLEEDRDEIMDGSIAHTLREEPMVATVRAWDGEPIATVAPAGRPGELIDAWRFTTCGTSVATFRYHFFCPELLTEIAARFALRPRRNGYWQ